MSIVDDELPEGWAAASLDELADIVRGITFPSSEKQPEGTRGTVACLRTTNVQDKLEWDDLLYVSSQFVKRDDQWLCQGDTVISMANSYELVGKVAFAADIPVKATFGGFLAVVRARGFDSTYFFHLLRHPLVRDAIQQTASRTVNIANISLKGLRPLQLPLAPLPEQRRIVTKLEALQARSRKARETLEAIPPLLEQFRQSVLAAAFRGDLTADWREQHPDVEPASVLLERIRTERRCKWEQAELAKFKAKGKVPKDDSWKERYIDPEPVDDADLPELPEGWCWVALDNVATHKSGLAYSSQDFTDAGVQVVKLGTLYQGRFDLTRDPAYLPTDHPELDQGHVKPGDILVSQTGTRFRRDYGHFVAIPDGCGPLVLNQRVLAVTVATPTIQKWVEFASRTDIYRDHLFASETGGVNQGNVGIAGIMRGPIPLAPLDEILKITSLLEQSFTASHSVQDCVLSQLKELAFVNQSILAKAFRGELVPQDPNDEPASVLLERIRAERAGDTNGNPARGRRKRTSTKAGD